ncbi:hypothetical protein ACQZV8_14985 [Magnetococcales bacterium HHB-1]
MSITSSNASEKKTAQFLRWLVLSILGAALIISMMNGYALLFFNRNEVCCQSSMDLLNAPYARRLRPYEMIYTRPKTLILGSSRTLHGMSEMAINRLDLPTPAYNASLSSASMTEVAALGERALRSGELRVLMIGLDLTMFYERKPLLEKRFLDRLQKTGLRLNLSYGSEILFSPVFFGVHLKQALQGSLKAQPVRRGFIDPELYAKRVKDRKKKLYVTYRSEGFFRQRLLSIRQRLSWHNKLYTDQMTLLSSLINSCRSHDITLYLWINPMHDRLWRILAQQKSMGLYQQWRRDLLALSPDILWDFSGPHSWTLEPIISENSPPGRRFWSDPSHFTFELGTQMLHAIFTPSKLERPFGKKLR